MRAKIVQINESLGSYSAVTDTNKVIVFSLINEASLHIGDVILGDVPENGVNLFKLENSSYDVLAKIAGIHPAHGPHYH